MKADFEVMQVEESRLEKYARNTAIAGKMTGYVRPGRDAGHVKTIVRRIGRCYKEAMTTLRSDPAAPPAALWLMDNFHLVKEAETEIIQELRTGSRLPARGSETCLHGLCRELVRTGAWEDTARRISIFLEGYQSVRALRQRELALFYTYFRLSCLELILSGAQGLSRYLKEGRGDMSGLERGFRLLHGLRELNFGEILREANRVERILAGDPSGMYSRLDEYSRARCRRAVTETAKRRGLSESDVAAGAVKMAKTSAGRKRCAPYWLIEEPLGEKRRRVSPLAYILLVMVPPSALALWLGIAAGGWWVSAALYIPLTEVIKNLLDSLILRLRRPDAPLRLEDISGLEREGKTLCVVTELLTSVEQAQAAAGKLERYYLGNRDSLGFVTYGVLADLKESKLEQEPGNGEIISAAADIVNKLNGKYPGAFCLLARDRRYNSRDRKYMGWERKRGAIIHLTRLLRGEESDVRLIAGEENSLRDVKFIITLDSDTALNAGSAKELIGAMLFPLNTPETDGEKHIVKAGCGIIQPRVSPSLSAANRSIFSMLYAGQGGIDPYGGVTGDVYQDLFRRGSYTGKGIIHVESFARCMDGRFPENRVLSHDLLEGSYLRCGYLSNTELSDGFPYKVTSYFARMDRWTRGDWQIIPWLMPRVKNEMGMVEKNPLDTLAKWKIFDNLRRSLRDVGLMAAILAGCFFSGRAGGTAVLTAAICAASGAILGAVQALLRPTGRIKYHGTVISGFEGSALITGTQLLFLPYSAWVSLRGIVTALWRMVVTKRGLLNWVTSADADKYDGSVWSFYLRMLPAVVIALAVMLLTPYPPAVAAGFVWLLSPYFAWHMSRPQAEKEHLAQERDRDLLRTHAGKMLRYFTDNCTRENNFLPPDNVQLEPYKGAAKRTSPTNIGLGMLSVLAGLDMGLLGEDRCLELLEHMTAGVEKLPKFRGHLYNWYETDTLRPMEPRCVSAVDSGNFIGCMTALRRGLTEIHDPRAAALAERVEKLEKSMDTGFFYDGERKLMSMGWDCGKNAPMPGHYDMLESEARLLSYIACARNEAPRRHWRQLSRSLTQEGGYQGLVSWTGTMFEYLMPRLLLPGVKNSLLWESGCFCLYAQRRRCAGSGVPWGISESAYGVLDPAMNYRYKAHGVQALGLKRGLDRELVVSPYSTFLALAVSPERAVRNLRRLEKLGISGEYGLIEAADFTPGRTGGDSFVPVRCYMAHHLGMSIVACANALNNDIMVCRFMSDDEMGAMRELLEEKIPVNVAVIPPRSFAVPERTERLPGTKWTRKWDEADRSRPECALLANPAYSLLATDGGESRALMGGRRIYNNMQLWLEDGEEITRLLPGKCAGEFSEERARYCLERDEMSIEAAAQVPDDGTGEVRRLEIENRGAGRKVEIALYFEPVLETEADFSAHPAFSKLSIESALEDGAILFRRRSRSGERMTFLALRCSESFTFDTSRMEALGRGGAGSIGRALECPGGGTLGAVLDPCAFIRVSLDLAPGERRRVSFSIAAGETAQEALLGSERCLGNIRAGGLMRRGAEMSGMTPKEIAGAMDMLSLLAFPNVQTAPVPERERLWRHGVSGDVPVAFMEFFPEKEQETERAIKQHALISRCGFESDLIIATNDSGEYLRPEYSRVWELIRRASRESALGVRGGVFIVQAEEKERDVLRRFAAWTPESTRGKIFLPPDEECTAPGGDVEYAFMPDGTFTFTTGERMPYCAWNNMLTNGRFGYTASDAGTGHMWHMNARENMLTPWLNDPLAVAGPERITFNGTSVFAHGAPCRVTYGFGWGQWEHGDMRVTAFVPVEKDCRVLILEPKAPGELAWRGEVVLGSAPGGAIGTADENCVIFENPLNRDFPGEKGVFLCRGMEFAAEGCRFRGRCAIGGETVLVSGCGVGQAEFVPLLDPETARRELEKTKEYWRKQVAGLEIETPDRRIDAYMNGWALYQTLACRVMGRSSMWQCGGAYGFRDQLQDVCAMIPFMPETAEEHILRSAGRQYPEGDVMHWWHENAMGDVKGVRTMCSDDLLWLPYAVCRYVECWDDMTLLSRQAEYLTSPPLEKGEQERYETPLPSGEFGDLFDHCVRAIDLVLERGTGEHGLCLMLLHDWNDGMNRVGVLGRGESVWLTWFAAIVLERFAPICRRRGETLRGDGYEAAARDLRAAAENCWDGDWYLRAFYDDGTPMGGEGSEECAMDSVAQSFAAFAGGSMAHRALISAAGELFDREAGIVKLLTPPFDLGDKSPGYIAGYVPGVRENGGQYTHAAVWLGMACLENGMRDTGWEVLSAIAPDGREQSVYRSEPYAICADVYSNPQHRGRGGWSWYTGAAGWYHQAVMGSLLGIRVCRGWLTVKPNIPENWQGFDAVFRSGGAQVRIRVARGKGENSHPEGIYLPDAAGVMEMRVYI